MPDNQSPNTAGGASTAHAPTQVGALLAPPGTSFLYGRAAGGFLFPAGVLLLVLACAIVVLRVCVRSAPPPGGGRHHAHTTYQAVCRILVEDHEIWCDGAHARSQ